MRSFFVGITVAVCCLAGQASADLLASYEALETNLTVTSPDPGMTLTWPVPGGTEGAPMATEGTSVLKMEWTGETDRKVEVKHEWTNTTFDLVGFLEIRADVYVATASAMPSVVGIWDDAFGWIGGVPLPPITGPLTGQWITISMFVGDLNHTNLDQIWAFIFDGIAGVDGTIYIDNLRLVPPRQIEFAGKTWTVKHGYHGPGPNYFLASEEAVFLDESGFLHLKIIEAIDMWYCSEVIIQESPGYGTYVFTVQNRVDLLDERTVLGLFTWDSYAPRYNYREIDFEFSRWGNPMNTVGQYVIQPWEVPVNMHRFDIDYTGPTYTTTHVMNWQPGRILFQSYYGAFALVPPPENIIESWLYTGHYVPPAGGENARMNFWLMDGLAPANVQDAEVIIADYQYLSDISILLTDVDNDGDVDLADASVVFQQWSRDDCDATNTWCNRTDFDGDRDVDLDDFATLAGRLTGPF